MALYTFNELLRPARREGVAVAAINIANYETAVAVYEASEQVQRPVIIQMYSRMFGNGKAEMLIPLLRKLAEKSSQKIAVHLDHGASLEQVRDAIRWGCTSVMFDGSNLPMEENIRITREVVKLAKAAGVSTEAEIGHVAMGDEGHLTDPDEAKRFVEETGVDALAVAIGTAHGYYKTAPKLDIERCAAIADALPDTPLVLHGGSGTPMEDVKKVIRRGIAKINIATEFQDTFLKATRAELEKLNGKFLPIDRFMDPVREKCAAHAARLMKEFAFLQ